MQGTRALPSIAGRTGIALLISGLVAAGVSPAAATAPSTAAVESVARATLASSPVQTDVAEAPAAGDGVEVVELDLGGIDLQVQSELVQADEALPDPAPVEPELAPGLLVEDPLGALPTDAVTDVITEEMSVEPFSLMGVTWDLTADLDDVVVQYRTYTGGAWTSWGWAAASEAYFDETANVAPPTRGATDAIYVPDSTGVQVVVSSSQGTVSGVKVLLIDPGAGPEGTGASVSSGTPTDAVPPAPGDSAVVPAPTPGPSDEPLDVDPSPAPPAQTPEPGTDPTDPPAAPAPPSVEPSEPATETPDPADAPTTEPAIVDPATVEQTSSSLRVETASAVAKASAPAGVASAPLASAVLPQPRIVTRGEWGAGAPACSGGYASSTVAAVVHHTASSNNYGPADVPGILRGFLAYHTTPEAAGGRGWCDIGYNFLVDKFGTIYEGRAGGLDQPVIGVHVGGFNSRVIGVSAIGNYQEAGVTPVMAEGISQVIAWKFTQHGILANTSVTLVSGGGATKFPAGTPVAFNTIFGHRDASQTSCPGQYLYAVFGDIRNRVATLANPVVGESPQGSWDIANGSYDSVHVAGWALDPGTTGPINVQVTVDGAATTIRADRARSDVGAHGFDAHVPASPGSHTVCVRLVNVGGGASIHKGCRIVSTRNGSPVGVLDAVTPTASGVYLAGWARDPETRASIDVHVYVGTAGYAWKANQARPDVQATAPGEAGPNHGYSGNIALKAGVHTVCAYGINVGSGGNVLLGCRTVTVGKPVVNHTPVGSLDLARASSPSTIRVGGWALDPDTSSSIQVHYYVDGRAVQTGVASGSRPDIGALYSKGSAHGFDATLTVAAGNHTVCVYAIDTAGGVNPVIGCRQVTVTNQPPLGIFDVVTPQGGGKVFVGGWALDPDTTASLQVHYYVDGKVVGTAAASRNRPDIAAMYGKGPAHGFDAVLTTGPGRHEICIYAIDTAGGINPLLGCRTVSAT